MLRHQGSIRVEVKPLPVATCYCGLLEEKSTEVVGSGRKWWAVLAEGYLRLFLHYGEEKERNCINVRKATAVNVKRDLATVAFGNKGAVKKFIEIRIPGRTWAFQGVTRAEQRKWEIKLKTAYLGPPI